MNRRDETHVGVLTPSGRGAVAVVGVRGPLAVASVDGCFFAANGRSLIDQPIGRIVYGVWGEEQGEDLVIHRREEEALEIHCHGGHQSSAQIVADLVAVGCTLVDARLWLAGGCESAIAVAARLALAKATTLRTATILLDQYQGALERELKTIDAQLVEKDFVGASVRLERLLDDAAFGLHLTEPWRVVIAGRPNVGKSSLINALVGYQRAIVFDQPGTTRDIVSSTTAIDGWPVELSDTAGLHEATGAIETAGIALARERLVEADLVVWVLEAVAADPWELAKQQAEAVGIALDRLPVLIVMNKIDLLPHPADVAEPSLGTCAVTGAGIEPLLAAIAERLVPVVPPAGAAVPFASEQIEFLRTALNASSRKESLVAGAAIQRMRSLC